MLKYPLKKPTVAFLCPLDGDWTMPIQDAKSQIPQIIVFNLTFYDYIVNGKIKVIDFKGHLLSPPGPRILSVVSWAATAIAKSVETGRKCEFSGLTQTCCIIGAWDPAIGVLMSPPDNSYVHLSLRSTYTTNALKHGNSVSLLCIQALYNLSF